MDFKPLINKSRAMMPLVQQNRTFHFSFILKRNKILAYGHNKYKDGSKYAINNGYPFGFLHSEVAAILNYRFAMKKLYGTKLINIRLSRDGHNLMMAKPCKHCLHLISQINFDTIYYSTPKGFKEL